VGASLTAVLLINFFDRSFIYFIIFSYVHSIGNEPCASVLSLIPVFVALCIHCADRFGNHELFTIIVYF
jgi:hypothetical protein